MWGKKQESSNDLGNHILLYLLSPSQKKTNFKIIGSAHNYREIIIKEKQGCEEIFISPIFFNKKNKSYLGVIKFNYLALATNRKIIALGGINQSNIKRLLCTKSKGYAGISGIKKPA